MYIYICYICTLVVDCKMLTFCDCAVDYKYSVCTNTVWLQRNIALEHSPPPYALLELYSSLQAGIQKAASQFIYSKNFYETKLFNCNKAEHHFKCWSTCATLAEQASR